MFDESAHAGPGDTTTTEYLNGISCGVLGTLCTIALQEPDRSCCADESVLSLAEEQYFFTLRAFVLAAYMSAGRPVSCIACANDKTG